MGHQLAYSDHLRKTQFSARTYISWLRYDGQHVQGIGVPWPAVEIGSVFAQLRDVDEPHDGCPRLDVLVLRGHTRSSSNPLRVGRGEFETILERLMLPGVVVRYTHSNNGELSLVPEYNDESDPGSMTHMSMLLHSPVAEINSCTFALRFSLQTGNASGILIVEAEKQLFGLREDVSANLGKLHASPLYIVVILADRYGRRNEARRESLDDRLVELEDRMGVCPFVGGRRLSAGEDLETGADGEEAVIHELHDNNTRLIWLSGTTNFEIMAIDFVVALLERGLPVVPAATCSVMLEELKSLKSSAELRQFQRLNLQQRAETRIAMLYSRISQRDSKVSIDVAEQSHKIAETTREDSRIVRSIAVVSFMFLPATFVATIFGTGLFDFHNGNLVVSKYWWVFVSLSTVLTALVVVGWSQAKRVRRGRLRNVQKERNRTWDHDK